jgi:hypothetical protein
MSNTEFRIQSNFRLMISLVYLTISPRPKDALECGREASAFVAWLFKAAASRPHSKGFTSNYAALMFTSGEE